MEFCPTCGNMLQIENAHLTRRSRFFCPTCPYVCEIERKITRKHHLGKKKEVEPIFSEAEAMKHAPTTEATCPVCHHGLAYFTQMQTRSADEPMTTNYKCCSCGHNWKEN